MQDNVITLAVDSANNGTLVDFALTRTAEELNRTTYEFPDHTVASRKTMHLYRTYAKRSGNSRGSTKCALKVTLDASVANADGSGSLVLPVIGEISFSVPVGTDQATLVYLRQVLIAALDRDDVVGKLVEKLHI